MYAYTPRDFQKRAHDARGYRSPPLAVYGSLGEFVGYIREQIGTPWDYKGDASSDCGTNFTQCATLEEACAYVERGASEAEQAATLALLEKIETAVHGRTRASWEPSVCGAYPIVPDFLAGMPENMRHRVQVEHEQAPVRLVVQTGVSAGVSVSLLAKRGAAIAALALKLAEIRPVELWVAWAWSTRNNVNTHGRIRLDITNMSVSQIIAVVCSAQFNRAMLFTAVREQAQEQERGIPWHNGERPATQAKQERLALALDPQDIYLPGGHLTEADAFARDPVAWVNSYLDPQRELEA